MQEEARGGSLQAKRRCVSAHARGFVCGGLGDGSIRVRNIATLEKCGP